MLDTERQKIADKIAKLLAKAGDVQNDNETICAIAKAQELLVKYKMSMADVKQNGSSQGEIVQKTTEFCFSKNSSDHYVSNLAAIIAENFCCISYFRRRYRSHLYYVAFMGYASDVNLCIELMASAMAHIHRAVNQIRADVKKRTLYYKTYSVSYVPASIINPLKAGYAAGFVHGLSAAFKQQKKDHEEWGIILSVPDDAQAFAQSIQKADLGRDANVDASFYASGYEDGNGLLNKKVVGEQDKLSG